MADKQEKDLDQASDCGWIRGLDANGNPIKLNKADMVELIRANMPVATSEKSGLMDKKDKVSQLRYISGKGYHRIVSVTAHYHHASFIISLSKRYSIRPSVFLVSFKGAEVPIIKNLINGGAPCNLYHKSISGNYELWVYLEFEGESFACVDPLSLFVADFSDVLSDNLPDNTIEVAWPDL